MQKVFRNIILLFLLVCFIALSSSVNSYSQEVNAVARIDTNQILIGDQFVYKINVTSDKKIKLSWPTFLDTLYNFEIIDRSKFDTVSNDGNSYSLQQSFVLTTFDSGYYVIPPIRFDYKLTDDSTALFSETDPLLVTVNTVAVDTNANIKDIKPPIHVPVTLREMAPYIAGVFGLFALIVLAIVFYRRYKNRKKGIVVKEPEAPAHVIAFQQLQKLNENKLWQNGKIKMYYSELSDIIRLYIENRYNTPALEMTTDEILGSGLVNSLSVRENEELVRILRTADLAKFAKSNPLPNENELNWQLAYEFVDKTRIIEPKLEEVK